MGEEVGELNHAYLKLSQGIRGSEEKHRESIEDAVGDILIFLVNFCSHLGIDVSTALQKTWNEVQKRDWVNNPDGPKGGDTDNDEQAGLIDGLAEILSGIIGRQYVKECDNEEAIPLLQKTGRWLDDEKEI